MRSLRKLGTVFAALALTATATTLTTTTASAEGHEFKIAFTDGKGAYPLTEPRVGAAPAGPAIPEGGTVTVECEFEGPTVENSPYPSTKIWTRLQGGAFISQAFLFTGRDGWTPGVPRCEGGQLSVPEGQAQPSAPSEKQPVLGNPTPPQGVDEPHQVPGEPLKDGESLFGHYRANSGTPVKLEASFFNKSSRFVSWVQRLEIHPDGKVPEGRGEDQYNANLLGEGEMYLALGTFSVIRTSTRCYIVKDTFDFSPNKVQNWPYFLLHLGEGVGMFKKFEIYASGCF